MKFTQGIRIDGTLFDVPLLSIKRNFDVLDKYAERNEEDGDLLREVAGVYANYTLAFGTINDDDTYEMLINKLTEPIAFHDFEIPTTKGIFEFKGYISQVSDEISKIMEDTAKFKGLTCKFTMKEPFRTP
ncbi:MAG: hypothetical protein IJO85_07530 [Lachnospiraceae bacterium]|nr:hypothetical protein [Lachnospiraceae bacterium]